MDGALFGDIIVFTGALAIKREEVADMAAEAGCGVANSVSKKVTMLVVGTQGRTKLKGYEKSNRHRKAEALIEKGVEIQIFSENDFSELMGVDLPRREKRTALPLEAVIRKSLDDISEKFGLPVNPEALSSVLVMRMKTKMVISVWNPLIGFNEGFVASLGEDAKRIMMETRLSLCGKYANDANKSLLHIHATYSEIADMERPEYL